MAVKVTKASGGEVLHPDGEGYVLRDGHLEVTGESDGFSTAQVAIYAPGAWKRADVTKD